MCFEGEILWMGDPVQKYGILYHRKRKKASFFVVLFVFVSIAAAISKL